MSTEIDVPETAEGRITRLRELLPQVTGRTGDWFFVRDEEMEETYADGCHFTEDVIRAHHPSERTVSGNDCRSHSIATMQETHPAVGEFVALCRQVVPDMLLRLDEIQTRLGTDEETQLSAWRAEREFLQQAAAEARAAQLVAQDERREYGRIMEALAGWLDMTTRLTPGPWESALRGDLHRAKLRVANEKKIVEEERSRQDGTINC